MLSIQFPSDDDTTIDHLQEDYYNQHDYRDFFPIDD